jgi:hypothetical protein
VSCTKEDRAELDPELSIWRLSQRKPGPFVITYSWIREDNAFKKSRNYIRRERVQCPGDDVRESQVKFSLWNRRCRLPNLFERWCYWKPGIFRVLACGWDMCVTWSLQGCMSIGSIPGSEKQSAIRHRRTLNMRVDVALCALSCSRSVRNRFTHSLWICCHNCKDTWRSKSKSIVPLLHGWRPGEMLQHRC